MEDDPAEPEDDPQPEPEKPRFLLPDGCKDLIDALHLREQPQPQPQPEPPAPLAKAPPAPVDSSPPLVVEILPTGIVGLAAGSPKNLPRSVTLADSVTVRELAAAPHLESFHVIGSLMELNVFASVGSPLQFGIAAALCARYGVVALKSA
jgi:hypothetical protein